MRPITLFVSALGGVVTALAVSSQQRVAKAEAMQRIAERSPPVEPPAPPARQLPAPASSIPAHVVELASAAPSKPLQPLQLETSIRAPRVAAQDLYTYVTGLVRENRGAELGSTAEPNSTVLAAQTDMKLVKATGIYDTATRARGKELLGREFPQREPKRAAATVVTSRPSPSTPAPAITPQSAPAVVLEAAPPAPPPPPDVKVAAHTPRESAEALLMYVSQPGADLGTKKTPNAIVRDAQKGMQKLTADGIYGPKTAARITALTGKPAPKRS